MNKRLIGQGAFVAAVRIDPDQFAANLSIWIIRLLIETKRIGKQRVGKCILVCNIPIAYRIETY
jgi:hypothetical protein